jgi:type VI protein secretion system component VasK
MIKIERMVVRIPASMQARATQLVRQTAKQLAAAPQTGDRRIDALKVSLMLVRPELPTGVTTRRMSEAVQHQINHQPGGKL